MQEGCHVGLYFLTTAPHDLFVKKKSIVYCETEVDQN